MDVATKIAVISRSSESASARMRLSPARLNSARETSGTALRKAFCTSDHSCAQASRLRSAQRQMLVLALDHRASVDALEPADGEMTLSDALEMVHENQIDGGASDGAHDRQCAGGEALGHDHAKARGEPAHT